jgi:hypothetical protein
MSNANPIAAMMQISHCVGVNREGMRDYRQGFPSKRLLMRGAVILLAAVLALPALSAETRQAVDLTSLLEAYSAGRHEETVKAIGAAGDEAGRALRLEWPVVARRWIDEAPEGRHRRMLVAASLALETENIRAERGDWTLHTNVCQSYRELLVPLPAGSAHCVLQWAYSVIAERLTPDEAERAWLLAAAALAGGVRDWRLLHVPPFPPASRTQTRGLIDSALLRFPDDPELRFEQALASVSRFNTTVDGGRAVYQPMRLSPRGGEAEAAAMLEALAADPRVGPEAQLRLGYLHWTMNRDQEAAAALADAAARAHDADLRYLAQFLIGWTALQRGDLAAARPSLTAALDTRPNSQSAAVALAAIDLKEGEASRAYERARASLNDKAAADDPWRLFLYGHHPKLPARIAELRRRLQ